MEGFINVRRFVVGNKMTVGELIAEVNKQPNLDIPITISVDYHSLYPFRRVFTQEFLEVLHERDGNGDLNEIVLLFEGYSNNDIEVDK